MEREKLSEEILKELAEGKVKIKAVAERCGLAPYTVLQRMNTYKVKLQRSEEEHINSKKYREHDFKMKIGDFFTAIEKEVSKSRVNRYIVVEIYEDFYVGEKLSGGKWRTAFLKKDFKRACDDCSVQVAIKGGKNVDQKPR